MVKDIVANMMFSLPCFPRDSAPAKCLGADAHYGSYSLKQTLSQSSRCQGVESCNIVLCPVFKQHCS